MPLLRHLLQPSVHLLRSPTIISHAAAAPQLPLLASAARRHLCSGGGNNKKADASSDAANKKADADIPTPEPQQEPLSKLFTTLRGLWKLQTAGPELRKQMEARLAASKQVDDGLKLKAEAAVKQVSEHFEGAVSGLREQEEAKNAMRKRMIEEKLSKVQLDPHKIQKRVTNNMLDKWESVLSASSGGGSGGGGGGGGGGGAAAPQQKSGGGGAASTTASDRFVAQSGGGERPSKSGDREKLPR